LKISGDILVTGGKWKNSSIIKVLIILFGHLQIHFWQIYTGVVDTGGKFAAGIIGTGGKLVAKVATGVVDTGGKFATGVLNTVVAP
jgi:hypothetical protein